MGVPLKVHLENVKNLLILFSHAGLLYIATFWLQLSKIQVNLCVSYVFSDIIKIL